MRYLSWNNWTIHITIIIFIIASILVEMCFYKKIFKPSMREKVIDHVESVKDQQTPSTDVYQDNQNEYTCGLYYSNWSPYPPRLHFPHDIDLSKISHIYYSFFLLDGDSGRIKSGDEWSDFEMDLYKPLAVKLKRLKTEKFETDLANKNLPMGLIGELNFLRGSNIFGNETRNFKIIMSVGGWSNRDEFPKMVRDTKKLSNFVDSCVDTMFKNGFDGIDLDWEFPMDDGFEPLKYLEITRKLRSKLDDLELSIFGSENGKCHPKFQLSMATPAFSEKLNILPIVEMNKYIDTWNMMSYDYYGEWSERTGYHSNLYGMSHQLAEGKLRKKSHGFVNDEGLNGDSAVSQMINEYGVQPHKICLGMAAYGRGFTNVKTEQSDTRFINKSFQGVGGASEGEPGMWLYNQLPIKGSQEFFDPDYVAAFCFDPKSKTFVGYDNVDSVRAKARYVQAKKLAGGFWWESCGEEHKNSSRSLVNAFANEARSVKKFPNSLYHQREVLKYYLGRYGEKGFLSKFFERLIREG